MASMEYAGLDGANCGEVLGYMRINPGAMVCVMIIYTSVGQHLPKFGNFSQHLLDSITSVVG